jgi:hypothetical protein
MLPDWAADAAADAAAALARRWGGQRETLLLLEEVLLVLSASVSFAGCALIFATWKRVAAPNYLSRRIITSLGLSGLLTAFGFFLCASDRSVTVACRVLTGVRVCWSRSVAVNGLGDNYARREGLCYLQAFTLQYFYLASYLWTGCFAFHLFQIIVCRNEYPEKFLWVYRAVAWGVPGLELAFLVLRQLTGHLGVGAADRRWCWIAVHEPVSRLYVSSVDADPGEWQVYGARQQMLLFYAPIAAVFVFNAVVYRRILKFLAADPMAARFRNKVVLYMGIFFLCSVWGAANRVVQFSRESHAPNAFLTLMECVCDPLQPLLNALAYGINKRSLDAYRARLCGSSEASSSSSASRWTAWMYSSLASSDDEDEDEDESLALEEASTATLRGDFGPTASLLSNDQLSPIMADAARVDGSRGFALHHELLDQEFAQYFEAPRRSSSGRGKRFKRGAIR